MARRRAERGAAIVDFVLVLVILVPLVLGILQLALVLHVRNTVSSAASEGARYAAAWGANPADGLLKAQEQLDGVIADEFVDTPQIEVVELAGAPAYRVVINVAVPALGLGGPEVSFQVSGNAVIEPDPAGSAVIGDDS